MNAKVEWVLLTFVIWGLAGCKSPGEGISVKNVAIINLWSSPNYPSLTFRITSDGSLSLINYVYGRGESRFKFKLSKDSSDALLSVINSAYVEVKNIPKYDNVAGGVNIRIIIGDDDANAATIRNYVKRIYKLKQVPIMLDVLKDKIPERYWR